jgi:hypothetical protein
MTWILVALAGILASEAMLRLPLIRTAKGLAVVSQKSMHVLASKKISDHWKERILPAYSLRMAKNSVGFFLFLCLALLPVVLVGLAFPGGLAAWTETLLRPLVILVLCAVSIAYIWLRVKLVRG